MSWDDFRIFLALHRSGSHAAAARALGVDPTTVSRRIATLEASLGARLFHRTPEGHVVTDAGAALVPRAERVEAEIVASEQDLRGTDARVAGTVRITAGDGLVHYVLMPRLGELRRRHPELSVELRADTRSLDLSRREADVAVRLGRPKEPALVARTLGPMRFGLYASRVYLERRGSPRTLRDLASHELVGFDASFDRLPQVAWLRRHVPEPRWVVRANGTTAQVLACAEGHGVALLPTFVAAHEPRLVRLLARVAEPSRDAFVVLHEGSRKSARIAAVVVWITEVTTTFV